MTVNDFVAWVYPEACKGEISPVFVTAQAALESGWGKSGIGNNLFGITKGSSWTGRSSWSPQPSILIVITFRSSCPNVSCL